MNGFKLIILANQPSDYSQEYGYNALRWDGDKWWSDCSNLMKALFNGRDINDKTPGKFEENTSNTEDVNANLIHMNGHLGAYIGKDIETEHDICNVVESTSAWKRGIQFSYVDSMGRRLYGKNGKQYGTWIDHGKPSLWISY